MKNLGKKVDQELRDRLQDSQILIILSEKEVRRELDKLRLREEDLGHVQWRQLGGRLEADYVAYGSVVAGTTGNVVRVSIADTRSGEEFLLFEETLAGDGKDEIGRLGEILTPAIERFIDFQINLLFCTDYRNAHQYDDALRNCRKALELFPESTSGLLERAITFVSADRCEDAITDLMRMPEGLDGFLEIEVGTHLILAHECLGNTEEALRAGLAASIRDSTVILATLGQTPSSIIPEYDRFEDQTVYATPWYLANMALGVLYRAQFTCPGREPCEPISIQLVLVSKSQDWIFLQDHQLVILADEHRFDLGQLEHNGDVKSGGVTEVMDGLISVSDFEIINVAKSVEARLGSTEFRMLDGVREGFRKLLHTP